MGRTVSARDVLVLYLGLRPRLVWDGPSALKATIARVEVQMFPIGIQTRCAEWKSAKPLGFALALVLI